MLEPGALRKCGGIPDNEITMTDTVPTRSAGRPRAPQVDALILNAALRELAENGYRGMSIDAVARTTGVSKATIYRRWATKADVAIAALATRIDAEPHRRHERFSDRALIQTLVTIRKRLLEPNNMALVGTVLAEEKQTPKLIELFRKHVWRRRSNMLRKVLEEARAGGQIRADTNIDVVIDMLVGSMYASYLRSTTIPATWPARVVETLMRGLNDTSAPESGRRERPARDRRKA
jgi:AcrR family transcriptional regulator